jgi:hypothetical protein
MKDEIVITVEMTPPKGPDVASLVKKIKGT